MTCFPVWPRSADGYSIRGPSPSGGSLPFCEQATEMAAIANQPTHTRSTCFRDSVMTSEIVHRLATSGSCPLRKSYEPPDDWKAARPFWSTKQGTSREVL